MLNTEEFHWKNYEACQSIVSRNWLCEKYHHLVSATRRRMMPNAKDWEDIEQEGVITLIKAIETYDRSFGTKFTTYAIRCIRSRYCRLAGQYLHRVERQEPLVDDLGEVNESKIVLEHPASPEELIIKAECCAIVRHEVGKLEPHLQEVLIRRYWEEKTLQTIALELNRSVPAIFGREKTCFKVLKSRIPEDIFW